ncbi:hypothetical protein BU23DRAFT_557850 [Bimuria novae-zelandiae CBS 107.79]|uniref:Uncharacterized protein n=1 Tax=Bimuria novae-zelandiae CBS 107.79 TaxID=1447943 RepID=A0A6A5UWI5_9PLEO|nr:hypothetical protein BU23DRAFT_557850 [Bimuria novae-zelandiae CBS 107.79]
MFDFFQVLELRSIALTHPNFSNTAQGYLFRTIDLEPQLWAERTVYHQEFQCLGIADSTARDVEEDAAPSRLLALIYTKPKLANNIHHVRLHIGLHCTWASEGLYFYYNPAISDILYHTSNLEDVEIKLKCIQTPGQMVRVEQLRKSLCTLMELLNVICIPKLIVPYPNTFDIFIVGQMNGVETVRNGGHREVQIKDESGLRPMLTNCSS